MSDVLGVAAFQVCDPILLLVLVEAYDFAVHCLRLAGQGFELIILRLLKLFPLIFV